MSVKVYRLKIKKIPLPDDIKYPTPHFPAFGDLHLDLLENKDKLKKNPPKPLFVYPKDMPTDHFEGRHEGRTEGRDKGRSRDDRSTSRASHRSDRSDDFDLEELEHKYTSDKSSEVFSNASSRSNSPIRDRSRDHSRGRSRERRSSPSPDRHRSDKRSPDRQDRPDYKPEQFQADQQDQESEEEKERKAHADLLFKFSVLKIKYKNADIPEFTEHSDIATMRQVYEKIIRKVNFDSTIKTYKRWLSGSWVVTEYLTTNWLHMDFTGFANSQQQQMDDYELLLTELGEKNYSTEGSRFPVEIRLIGLVVFNAAIFYVQKLMFSNGSAAVPALFTQMFAPMAGIQQQQQQGQQPAGQQPGGQPTQKPAMRGPTITPADIKAFAGGKTD